MNTSSDDNDQSHLFLRDKQAWENAIAAYNGSDPLELWYNYVCWYDYNIHIDPENKFRESLEKCLTIFEYNENYKQDIRMVKLWVKYVDLQPNPLNLYQALYDRNIGTECACFYISWAHYYDSANAFKQAESVYNLGFQAKAEPYMELQEAHTKFRLSLSQRMLYDDSSSKKRSASHLNEQRQQITTLTPPNKKICSDMEQQQSQQQQPQHHHQHQQQQASQTQTNLQQTHQNQQLSSQQPHLHQKSNKNSIQVPSQQQQQQQHNHYNQHSVGSHQHQVQHHNQSQNNHHSQSNHNHYHNHQSQQQHHQQQQEKQHQHQEHNHQTDHHHSQLHHNQPQQQQHNGQLMPNQQHQQNHHYHEEQELHNHQQHEQQHQNGSHTTNSYSNGVIGDSDQCNLNKSAYVISSSLNYIYDDTHTAYQDESQSMVEYILENCKIPANFARYAKNNHDTWKPLLCLEEPFDANRHCSYAKQFVYPGDGTEFSPEEIRSRKWGKHLQELHDKRRREEQLNSYKHHNGTISKHNGIQAAKQVSHSVQTNEETNSYDNYEEQIEESTIRFSTDMNGSKKSKTIKIKFRREKPSAVQNQMTSHDTNNVTPSSRSSSPEARSHHHHHHHHHHHRHSSKPKKIKKIKIVNDYSDPKYLNSSNNVNNNNQSDYYAQSHKSKSGASAATVTASEEVTPHSAAVSRNQFEDANLLLSIANMHSNDSSPYPGDLPSTISETIPCNDDSISNSDFHSSYHENSYLSISNCSTPVRKLSQSFSKTSTPHHFRSLKKHTSNASLQNDDSMCSYEQNSFFTSESNDELKQKRLEKALNAIDLYLSKPTIDPFSTELCKAFLTKIGFPSRESNDIYKLLNTPIPKLVNTKTTTLDNVNYSIEKEVGRGAYGSVYRATNTQTGAVVALKFQKPPNTWEVYICAEVRKRITYYDILPGFMDLSTAIIAPNASILVTEFSSFGSLLDINNKLRQATKKVMHESLVMHFSSQILNIVNHLHSCKIIHADIKPDNFLLMRVPSSETHIPSLRLIDFGCAIDMTLFPENTQFKKVIQTDGFTCIEMQEGRPWSYQTDLFCIAGTIHVMLFGEYMQLVKKFGAWDIKQKLPRYLKKHVWTEFFGKMLNIKDVEHLPDLSVMKNLINEEAIKMDSELQTHIRTLSNLLYKR